MAKEEEQPDLFAEVEADNQPEDVIDFDLLTGRTSKGLVLDD